MSYALLKDNIESLLAQKKYNISKVEGLAGLKQGNLNNILCGRSKRPAAEVLLPIAKVFGVKVEDLFADKKITSSRILSKEETTLYLDITAYLNDKIIAHNIEVHYQDFTSTINEIYDYFESNKDYNMDTKFVNWFIKQKFNLD